ncbi:signal peptidase I [Candidatus Enterococcus clewellii]|uniref:Signal peptidase I n=1 Tax=Candidatus Enterococcus clewellii TaxID=1834193 RepID=A0A242JUX8_9ENTE|nr:signal peptidase I [Enterococcus sp. 9E7_DIV0242]OTP06702.1 hypothetical protein A5888_004218 [Enterococcus sp. 9E7_DIV0242]
MSQEIKQKKTERDSNDSLPKEIQWIEKTKKARVLQNNKKTSKTPPENRKVKKEKGNEQKKTSKYQAQLTANKRISKKLMRKTSQAKRSKCPSYKKGTGKKQHSLKMIRKRLLELWAAIISAVFIFLIVSSFFIKITKVSGYSMMPTLQDNNTVLVQKTASIERFDLVLFQRGKTQQIRRIIGLPGEQITYTDDFLYVNGEPVDEKFIIDEINEAQKNGGQYTADFQLHDINNENKLPKDSYLVLGDNREYGFDSREYGLIDRQQIIGIVKIRVWPLNGLSAF